MDSSPHGRLEASKERWRDELAAERQEPLRGDEEMKREQSSLQGRLEASKERRRAEEGAERQ